MYSAVQCLKLARPKVCHGLDLNRWNNLEEEEEEGEEEEEEEEDFCCALVSGCGKMFELVAGATPAADFAMERVSAELARSPLVKYCLVATSVCLPCLGCASVVEKT